MAYCTAAQVKELLQTSATDQDVLIGVLCNRVTALIDRYTGKTFASTTRTYRLDGDGSALLVLPTAPVQAITSVSIDGATVQTTDYAWYEDGRIKLIGPGVYSPRLRAEQFTFTCGLQNVVVEGTFGYASVPGDVEQAALTQVARWLRAKDNSFADATGTPDGGQLVFAKVLYPEVKGILDGYRVTVGRLVAI